MNVVFCNWLLFASSSALNLKVTRLKSVIGVAVASVAAAAAAEAPCSRK